MKYLGFLMVGSFIFVGCQNRPKPDAAEGFGTRAVSLRGTYGVAQGGVVEPVLKVDETKTGYAFEERITGEWRADPAVPHVASEEEVRQALKVDQLAVPVFGLANDREILLKLPAGWSWNGFLTKSGYVLVSGGVTSAAERVELGGR